MRALSVFACYLLLSCSAPAPGPGPAVRGEEAPATAQPPAQSQSPQPSPPATQPEITITSVSAANPVVVEGRARTFENNVVVRVLDAEGQAIRETFTTADGEMGHHNPYRAEVFVTRDPGAKLTVQALEYSARDGSERSLVSKTIDYRVEVVEADLFLPEKNPSDCSRVLPNPRRMPKSVAMARLLVEALIHDPASPFPKGSAVQGIALRNGVLTVDFNERLQNVGGSCAALAVRSSVEQTLRNLPSINRVVITAGGSEKLALQP